MSYTSVFGGTTIYPSDVSYLPLALAADTTLEWPLEASGDVTVAARIIGVTPASAGLSVIMPDATRTGPGQSVLFNNMSGTYSFLVKDDGGSTLATVTPGTQWQIYLTDNTTAAGTWEVYQMGASTATVQASALAGPGLTVVGAQLAQAADFSEFTTDLQPSSTNRATTYVYTGSGAATVTLPTAPAVDSTYFIRIRNQGGGVLLVDPAGTDLINGATSLNLAPEDSAVFIFDGASKWYTVGLGQNAEFTFDFTSIPVTGGTYTLSGNQLNRIAYRFTGTLTSNAVIVVPATVQQYWVDNQTTGSFTLGLRTPTQVSPTLVNQNASAIMYSDGTSVVLADTSTLSLPVSVAQGGTGASTPTGARANLGISPYADPLVTAANSPAAQAVLFPNPITDGQMLIGNAATPGFAQTTLTAGTGINVLNGPGTVTIVNTGSPAPGSVYSQRFSGTGSQTAFTLSYQPYTEENTQVYINGVYQQKDTYSLSGFVLTFSVAPPLGTDNIEVVVIQVTAIGVTTADLVSLTQGGSVQDILSGVITPYTFGAVGNGVNDTTALAALVTANNAEDGTINVPPGTYVTNSPLQPENYGIRGASKLAVIKAGSSFPATMTRAYANTINPGGTATFPAAVVATVRVGDASRNPIESLLIDGGGFAPNGLYIPFNAGQTVRDVLVQNCTNSGVVIDAHQNTEFRFVANNCNGPAAQLLQGIANCRVLYDARNIGSALLMKADSTYPGYNMPGTGTSGTPRQVIIGGIHEALTGTPSYAYRVADNSSDIVFDRVETTIGTLVSSGGTVTSFASMQSVYSFANTRNISMVGCIANGLGSVYPTTFSVVDFDGAFGSAPARHVVNEMTVNLFNPGAVAPIRAVIRHRNGALPLIVRHLNVTVNNSYRMLIESDSSNVTYEPSVRFGNWFSRPTGWIDATVFFTDVALGETLTKAASRALSGVTQAAAIAGATQIEVTGTIYSNILPGDVMRVLLDSGEYQVVTVTGRSASGPPYYVTFTGDALEGAVASGNAFDVCGRWFRPNGLPWNGIQTYTAGDTAPNVCGMSTFTITNAAPTTISRLSFGRPGQRLMLEFADSNTTIQHSTTQIRLLSGANLVGSTTTKLQLVLGTDSVWYEVSARPFRTGTIAATTDASGDIVVTHNLGFTPTIANVQITGTTFATAQVNSVGATTFTARFFGAGGAALALTAVTARWNVS